MIRHSALTRCVVQLCLFQATGSTVMTKRRVLVQWIGHSDLRAMAAGQADAKRDEILRKIGGTLPRAGDVGPIKTLLNTQSFDEVHLLSNYSADWSKRYIAWVGVECELVRVDLDKPTDYPAIFKIADAELSKIRHRPDWPNTELCLHLSPGTPAMAAVWLLLGKTRYPATFYETYGGQSWIAQVPFDLTIDVIPEILRDPDVHLHGPRATGPVSTSQGFSAAAGSYPSSSHTWP
jgi:hypothetical protein